MNVNVCEAEALARIVYGSLPPPSTIVYFPVQVQVAVLVWPVKSWAGLPFGAGSSGIRRYSFTSLSFVCV